MSKANFHPLLFILLINDVLINSQAQFTLFIILGILVCYNIEQLFVDLPTSTLF